MVHPAIRVAVYFLLIGIMMFVIGGAVVMVLTTPSHGAANICERHRMVKVITNGGRSWRCKKYASRRHSQPVALRVVAGRTRTDEAPPAGMSDAIRTVRIVPIFHGATVNERVQRAFDRLMIFPVIEEE